MTDIPATSPTGSLHELDVASEGVEAEAVTESFKTTVGFAHQVLTGLPQFAEVPSTRVTAVITSDFVSTVQRVLDETHQPGDPYQVERLGGVAVAKTTRTADDYSDHTVVFDARLWPVPEPGGVSAYGLVLAAHEMSHVMLGRARWASGALEGVLFPSVTPVEAARSMVRTAVEELRADILAGSVLGVISKATVDGVTRPTRPGDLFSPDGYRRQLAEVLDANVYPGWPDTVQRYREHQMPLETMWKHIGQSTDQVLTLLAHAQAEANFAGSSDALFGGPIAEHRAVELYLRPMWAPVMEALGAQGSLPEFADTCTAELELLSVGEESVLAMWETLGLSMDVQADRTYAIWVAAPER